MSKYIHEILYNIIFLYLVFYDKHTFQKMNQCTNKIHVINLFDIKLRYHSGLNNKISKNYSHIVKLNAINNSKISNVNHMTKLKESQARWTCGIKNICDEIINLKNLEILNSNDNTKISNVNHITKLKELDAYGLYWINNEGIINFKNLEIFNACYNSKITNINHVTKLKELIKKRWLISCIYLLVYILSNT